MGQVDDSQGVQAGPLRDYLAVDVLDEPTAEGVRAVIDFCAKAIKAARSGAASRTRAFPYWRDVSKSAVPGRG
jgi:hypothetical protein